MEKSFVKLGKQYVNLSNIAYARFAEGDGSPYAEVYFIAQKNDQKEGNKPLRCTIYAEETEALRKALDQNLVD